MPSRLVLRTRPHCGPTNQARRTQTTVLVRLTPALASAQHCTHHWPQSPHHAGTPAAQRWPEAHGRMCTGHPHMLLHFMQGAWANTNFGIQGSPCTTPEDTAGQPCWLTGWTLGAQALCGPGRQRGQLGPLGQSSFLLGSSPAEASWAGPSSCRQGARHGPVWSGPEKARLISKSWLVETRKDQGTGTSPAQPRPTM